MMLPRCFRLFFVLLGLLCQLTLFAQAKSMAPDAKAYKPVNPIEILKTPATYLNQPLQFEGTFNTFSLTGLDYKPALRSSKEFVSLVVYRPDSNKKRPIPMTEFKLFYARPKAEALNTLNPGDLLQLKGKVFAVALGEPWFEVETLNVLKKAAPTGHAPSSLLVEE